MLAVRNMPRTSPQPQESVGQDVGDLLQPLLRRHLVGVGRVHAFVRDAGKVPATQCAVVWCLVGPPLDWRRLYC